MKVNEVINTKEIFTREVAENYYVIYEETLNKDYVIKNNYVFETDSMIERSVCIFNGDSCSTLQKMKAYPMENIALEQIKALIVNDFPEIFTIDPLT